MALLFSQKITLWHPFKWKKRHKHDNMTQQHEREWATISIHGKGEIITSWRIFSHYLRIIILFISRCEWRDCGFFCWSCLLIEIWIRLPGKVKIINVRSCSSQDCVVFNQCFREFYECLIISNVNRISRLFTNE